MKNLTDLEKYELVNSCETIEDLKKTVLLFADSNGMIQGRRESFNAAKMADGIESYIKDPTGLYPPNVATRNWGIRQQAMYLKYYSK